MITTLAVPRDGTPLSLAALALARLALLRVAPAAEAPGDPLLTVAQTDLPLTVIKLAGNSQE